MNLLERWQKIVEQNNRRNTSYLCYSTMSETTVYGMAVETEAAA